MGRALGLQAVGKGADRPSVVLGGKESQHPTVPPRAVPMRDHQAPHFPPGSLSSRHPGRCGTWTGPLFQWLRRLCIGGSPVCSRGSSSEPSRGAARDPRPERDPADALRSRLGPHCLSSAICRRRLRPRVLQTQRSPQRQRSRSFWGHVPLVRGVESSTRPWRRLGKAPREESVCAYFLEEREPFPPSTSRILLAFPSV